MKRLIAATAALLLALAALASTGAFAGAAATADPAQRNGHAHGFERFLQRYEAANSAFVNGDPTSGGGTHHPAIERANVVYAGQTERRQQVLRATMIFRFERGAWRIVHRHADTMVDLRLPT